MPIMISPMPARASTGLSISVFKRIPVEAMMKTIGTTGYPQVLYGLGISGYFLLSVNTAAVAAIQKIIATNIAKVMSCSNVPLKARALAQIA